MKKISAILLSATLLASTMVKADMMDYVKDYGIPCALALGASSLASKSNGGAIGLGVCVGVSASTYIQSKKKAEKMRDEDFKQFVKLFEEQTAKAREEQDKKLDESIKSMEERQKEQIQATRQVMKEVVAERIALIGDDTKQEMKRYMEKADFMQDLEKKVLERIKEEVSLESKVRQKEIVESCVDQSLRQLILKKVGAPQGE